MQAAPGAAGEVTRTPRTTVRRRPARASYSRALVHAVLDEGLVCHVGFAVDGQPFVLPTAYARIGDRLYLHGSSASRMLNALAGGVPACVTVTLLDGLVLARSAFHHSMNYRSVVLLGVARPVGDAAEKRRALAAIVEHVVPGRSADVRPPSDAELRATLVLALAIDEASAKVRQGPPVDDEADRALPCWAGEIPLRLAARAPVADPGLAPGIAVPAAVAGYRRPGAGGEA
jgi:nitroimidazol reductase NimA-like FMN-containing flavoprotein (pyridoxamine 5'-phosphate oxidase superfamily)